MNSNPSNMSAEDFIAYLAKHGITDYEKNSNGTEIAFSCPFHGCDDDKTRTEEFHCNFNLEKCVYHCFKCNEKGNFITLQKYFGDYKTPRKKKVTLDALAEKWHQALSDDYKMFFYERGINDESIKKHKLGYAEYNGRHWLSIPIFDKDGKVAYFKLRKLPDDDSNPRKYTVCPAGTSLTLCGIRDLVETRFNDVLICEGELDRIIAQQKGVSIPIITGGGATVFKDEWVQLLKNMRNIYICMDADETGRRETEKLRNLFAEKIPNATIYNVSLPYENGSKADLTDYFMDRYGTADDLFGKYSEFIAGAEPIDESKFEEMSIDDIATTLNLTIKHDKVNKVITFLAMLLTYTEEDQLNIMFNAGSSTGKSYICIEVSKLFPQNDVLSYGKTSPTAFYYNENLMREDPGTGQSYIDLERKILIFTEQPDSQLQANLRSFLSHDNKYTKFSITNKGKNGGNKSTDAYILGFSSTFFCTANMRIDEQEQTRCLILSPESTEEKIKSAIMASVIKNSDRAWFDNHVKTNIDRKLLMDRIQYIKRLNVEQIRIENSEYLYDRFMTNQKYFLPRSQRDIDHFTSLTKGIALVNAPFRMKDGVITATNKDVDEAMKLWEVLSESMRYGIPPQILDVLKKVIIPAYREINKEKNLPEEDWQGISFEELRTYYTNHHGAQLNMDMYRKTYIPVLVSASLISSDLDENDKRKKLIKPVKFFD